MPHYMIRIHLVSYFLSQDFSVLRALLAEFIEKTLVLNIICPGCSKSHIRNSKVMIQNKVENYLFTSKENE